MTRLMTAPAVSPDRKPRDDEIDIYGLTHPGKVRTDNQDHFLVCALRRADGRAAYQPGRRR